MPGCRRQQQVTVANEASAIPRFSQVTFERATADNAMTEELGITEFDELDVGCSHRDTADGAQRPGGLPGFIHSRVYPLMARPAGLDDAAFSQGCDTLSIVIQQALVDIVIVLTEFREGVTLSPALFIIEDQNPFGRREF